MSTDRMEPASVEALFEKDGDWQPLDKAPKDGRMILVRGADEPVVVLWGKNGGWEDPGGVKAILTGRGFGWKPYGWKVIDVPPRDGSQCGVSDGTDGYMVRWDEEQKCWMAGVMRVVVGSCAQWFVMDAVGGTE
jgi:hypothetical protein